MAMIFILFFFSAIYFFTIVVFSIGWFLNKHVKSPIYCSKKVSIIVAVRNEATTIQKLLYTLTSQSYSNFEIIIIDDHSTDHTNSIIIDFITNNRIIPILYFKLCDTEYGKKAALRLAIAKASGEIICTTDADCTPHENWVATMVSYLESGYYLVSGPVVFKKENSFLEKIFALEFLSLIGSGAGAIGVKRPIFCNGANMCYRKHDFVLQQSFAIDNYTSGDDVFLLHTFKQGHKPICFAKSPDAIVETYAPKTIQEFFAQRLRWASKAKGYRDYDSIFVSIIVFIINCSILITGCISFFETKYFSIFLEVILIKLVIDMFILIPTCHFFKTKKLLLFALPLLIVYPLYILSVGFFSFFMPFSWKGRKYIR